MSVPFNAAHYKRKGRLRNDPLYHGDECELLYHQIAALKIQRKIYAGLLHHDKSKGNVDMFKWLSEQIKRFKLRYEMAYLLSAVPEKRISDSSLQLRLTWMKEKHGIE